MLCRFWLQCSRTLRRRSAAARLLRSWVRIPPGTWMFVCCECCVLSGRGLCDELITRPEESYRLWCVVVCDLETSIMRRPWAALGCSATKKMDALIFASHFLVKLEWKSALRQQCSSMAVRFLILRTPAGHDLLCGRLNLARLPNAWGLDLFSNRFA